MLFSSSWSSSLMICLCRKRWCLLFLSWLCKRLSISRFILYSNHTATDTLHLPCRVVYCLLYHFSIIVCLSHYSSHCRVFVVSHLLLLHLQSSSPYFLYTKKISEEWHNTISVFLLLLDFFLSITARVLFMTRETVHMKHPSDTITTHSDSFVTTFADTYSRHQRRREFAA